jgi:hypothetical protein
VNSSGRRETTGEGRKELEPRVKDERQSKVSCTFCYVHKQKDCCCLAALIEDPRYVAYVVLYTTIYTSVTHQQYAEKSREYIIITKQLFSQNTHNKTLHVLYIIFLNVFIDNKTKMHVMIDNKCLKLITTLT